MTLITFRGCLRHPWVVIGVCALAFAFLLPHAREMKLTYSSDDLQEKAFQSAERYQEFKQAFNEGQTSFVVIGPGPGRNFFDEKELCLVRHWYSRQVLENPEVVRAFSLFDVRESVFDPGGRTTEKGVSLSRILHPLVLDLNCDLPTKSADDLLPKYHRIVDSPFGGLIASSQGAPDLAMTFGYRKVDDPKYGSFNPIFLQSMRRSFDQEVASRLSNIQVHWAGTADLFSYLLEGRQRTKYLNLALVILVLVSMRLLFGTWRSGAFYLATILFSTVCIFGCKALVGSPSDLLSDSLFLLMGLATLEDFIFISYLQLQYGESWARSTRRLLMPGFFTSVTTCLGLGSLAVSPLETIQRLGLWAAAGAMLEWALIFLALPAFLKAFYRKPTWVNARKAYFSSGLEPLTSKSIPRKLAYASFALYIGGVFAVTQIDTNDAPYRTLEASHPYRIGLEYLSKTRNWREIMSLVFPADTQPQQAQAIQSGLEKLENVTKVESLSRIEDYLVQAVPESARSYIGSALRNSSVAEPYASLDGRTRMKVYLKESDNLSLEPVKNWVSQACANIGCYLTGSVMIHSDFTTQVPMTLIESMETSIFLVGSVIFYISVALGQTRHFLPVVGSSFLGAMAMTILIWVFGVPLNFITVIFASVLVGLTGDNAIQYLFANRKDLGNGIQRIGGGSIQCNVVMVLASLTFLGSYFAPPKMFAGLLGGGLILSLIGDLWVLKSLLPEKPDQLSENKIHL